MHNKKALIKLLYEDSKLPVKRNGDVGWDCVVHSWSINNGILIYKLGISVTPPDGYFFKIFPRSSQSNVPFVFCNSVGIIDPTFTGELQVRMRGVLSLVEGEYEILPRIKNEDYSLPFKKGDKIGQLILYKEEPFGWQEAEELTQTERGDGGFGSTGK